MNLGDVMIQPRQFWITLWRLTLGESQRGQRMIFQNANSWHSYGHARNLMNLCSSSGNTPETGGREPIVLVNGRVR